MYAALLLVTIAATNTSDMQSVLDQIREAQDVPGVSAVIVRQDKVLFAGASGVADIESGHRMTADTKLYMGSLSKVLTAVLTLQLVESSQLSLADRVTGIADETADDGASISVAHLLTHFSGLAREGDFNYWYTGEFPDANELTSYLTRTELRTLPGTELHYSNVGYAALGLLIERASQQSYGEALHTRVLKPLGMTSTGSPGPKDGMANGYTPTGRIIPNAERPFAGVGKRVGSRHIRMYHDAGAMSPAFGVYTSAHDLAKFAVFLLGYGGDSVLSSELRHQMRRRQASGWGLGIKIQNYQGRTVARHDGWFAAHRSHLLLDMDNEIGVVILSNSDSATPGKIADALLEATLQRSL